MMRSIVQYFILKVVFELDEMNLLGLASPTTQNLYEIGYLIKWIEQIVLN